MKFLLDQGTPRSAASLLRNAGFDTIHTAEIGMATSADEDILRKAAEEDRTVVALDADFHSLLALSQSARPSVNRIRIEGLQAEELSELLLKVSQLCQTDLEAGAMISVQENRIRVRRLPIK